MKTPEKSEIEKEIISVIRIKLINKRRSKKWLAFHLRMDYGKVKRVLSEKHQQQLSLSAADNMLRLLDSSLRDTIVQAYIPRS